MTYKKSESLIGSYSGWETASEDLNWSPVLCTDIIMCCDIENFVHVLVYMFVNIPDINIFG